MAVRLVQDASVISQSFETASAEDVVRWAVRTFGDGLVMTSSFGADSAALLHLATRHMPRIRVIFIDTGFLFPETHAYVEELRRLLDLNIWHYRTRNDPFVYLESAGEDDFRRRRDVERCCAANKNEPMERAMRDLAPSAWLRGIRRSQSESRRNRQFVEWSTRYSCYAVSPLLNWTDADIEDYLRRNGLPRHPLAGLGYRSIGCSPLTCTRPVEGDEDPRAGRWAGTGKTECGLHLEDYQI
jgi:phosphoadenosine phosphosulfate reductase